MPNKAIMLKRKLKIANRLASVDYMKIEMKRLIT